MEISDNEVWPGKHEKEAFEVIVELMENEDVSKDESFLNPDVSLVIGAEEVIVENIQGDILTVVPKTDKTDGLDIF